MPRDQNKAETFAAELSEIASAMKFQVDRGQL